METFSTKANVVAVAVVARTGITELVTYLWTSVQVTLVWGLQSATGDEVLNTV
jgi:hypothetical protein